ncbi:hypothetical protein [Pseudomonas syringae group sp. J309-1]|uniref:hypothetical protein n=1 Tax=Pseudomonas syringae group sp. J309-1 TaxID=3079588 RepID=UPI002906ABF6|nr:hypothetical protein [Pseudomonas syringae group sp. J309-1]MDU8357690.1 hypothetical protein [Pseudomonas syringae group sp. J309-1]
MQPSQDLIHQPDYQALSAQQQRLMIASYTLRSQRLVEMFDRRYNQRLADIFCRGLSAYVAGRASDISDLHTEIEAHIPDTDEFSEQEASYAQNAFIALLYLMEATATGDAALLQRSVDMTLQNVDLLYYERDPDYLQMELTAAEQHVLYNLLEQAATTSSAEPATFELIEAMTSPHRL